MPVLTHDDPDLVFACPDCDVAGEVYRRIDTTRAYDDAPYRCEKCGASFDQPVERESRAEREPPAYDADGIPHGLSPTAKEAIRSARGGSD